MFGTIFHGCCFIILLKSKLCSNTEVEITQRKKSSVNKSSNKDLLGWIEGFLSYFFIIFLRLLYRVAVMKIVKFNTKYIKLFQTILIIFISLMKLTSLFSLFYLNNGKSVRGSYKIHI